MAYDMLNTSIEMEICGRYDMFEFCRTVNKFFEKDWWDFEMNMIYDIYI